MTKKLAAVFAALVIAISAMSMTVFAEGSCTLSQTSQARAGGTFTVDVILDSNPGLNSVSCNIRYDYQYLEFVEVSDSGLLGGFYYTNIDSNLQLTWSNGSDTTANGVLATVTFKALKEDFSGTMVYNTAVAFSANGISVPIDGATAILNFGDPLPAVTEPEVPAEPDPAATESSDLEQVDDDAEVMPNETEAPEVTEAPETTEAPTTTPAPTTTSATTTRRRSTTTAPTTTEPPTTTPAPTTTPPTTTAPPTTTPPPTTTEPPTTTALDTATEPVEEPVYQITTSEQAFAEIYDEGVDNDAANNGTMLIALIMIALTVVVVLALEVYKHSR